MVAREIVGRSGVNVDQLLTLLIKNAFVEPNHHSRSFPDYPPRAAEHVKLRKVSAQLARLRQPK